jgi:hypothetical protein
MPGAGDKKMRHNKLTTATTGRTILFISLLLFESFDEKTLGVNPPALPGDYPRKMIPASTRSIDYFFPAL